MFSQCMKYTEKGCVTLRIKPEESMKKVPETDLPSETHLHFEIEDTGIGIAPEDAQRIFEPFVQVNPGRTARKEPDWA